MLSPRKRENVFPTRRGEKPERVRNIIDDPGRRDERDFLWENFARKSRMRKESRFVGVGFRFGVYGDAVFFINILFFEFSRRMRKIVQDIRYPFQDWMRKTLFQRIFRAVP